jgi:two-component system, NarL family, nitrate/nitrite response regulator NarL
LASYTDVNHSSLPTTEPKSVLIVDDHILFTDAIRMALEKRGLAVSGVASTGAEAVRIAERAEFDLALVDLDLPDADGFDVAKTLVNLRPEAKVLVVTASNDPQMVLETMRLGLHGFLPKDTPLNLFMRSVGTALKGQMIIPHRLANAAAGGMSEEERDARLLARQLTARELEILTMLAEGATGADIRARLVVSPNTVRTHIQNILTKLQVHSRLEAAAFAVKYEIVRPEGPRSASRSRVRL